MKVRLCICVFLLLLLNSCYRNYPTNFTHDAYEDLSDVSIRLFFRHEKDTLLKLHYDVEHNLPGHVCSLIETTNQVDSNREIGFAIRFWSEVVLEQEGTFYGLYPTNGLLNKIDSIKVTLTANSLEEDISNCISGDSIIDAFVWGKFDYKKLPYGSYYYKGGQKNHFFEGLNQFKTSLNTQVEKFEGIDKYDFLFWIDPNKCKNLISNADKIKVEVKLIDSTGNYTKTLLDSMEIKQR